jgi:hypothetical protein
MLNIATFHFQDCWLVKILNYEHYFLYNIVQHGPVGIYQHFRTTYCPHFSLF